jgi:hypothetical protein
VAFLCVRRQVFRLYNLKMKEAIDFLNGFVRMVLVYVGERFLVAVG